MDEKLVRAESHTHYEIRSRFGAFEHKAIGCLAPAFVRGKKLGVIASQRLWTERLTRVFQAYGIPFCHLEEIEVVESFDNNDQWYLRFIIKGIAVKVWKEEGKERWNEMSMDLFVADLFNTLRHPSPEFQGDDKLVNAMVRVFQKHCEPHLLVWYQEADQVLSLLVAGKGEEAWALARTRLYSMKFKGYGIEALKNLARVAGCHLTEWEARREVEDFCLHIGLVVEEHNRHISRLVTRDAVWKKLKHFVVRDSAPLS